MGKLRTTIRRLRFFYKPDCRVLYKEYLVDYFRTLLFPFSWSRKAVFKDGTEIHIPRPYFDMLATGCRLKAIGARPSWQEGDMDVTYMGYRFFGPPDAKLMPFSLRDLLVEDLWRTGRIDLAGKTVLDVGAHIGVFAVACAKRGATVHAFEPFPVFQEFIRKNAAANGVGEKVFVHGVGLSDCDQLVDEAAALADVASSSHGGGGWEGKGIRISFVNGTGYLMRHGIGKAHFLKMNCEGCEYALLADERFLGIVRPDAIALEYHDGGGPLPDILRRRGYAVEWGDDSPEGRARKKGRMFALLEGEFRTGGPA